MDRVDKINKALNAMHKKDKGEMIQKIVAQLGISLTAFGDKRKRLYPFRESELLIVLEELKLPSEVQ